MRECRAGASAAEPVAFNRTFAAIGESGFLVGVLDLGPITRQAKCRPCRATSSVAGPSVATGHARDQRSARLFKVG